MNNFSEDNHHNQSNRLVQSERKSNPSDPKINRLELLKKGYKKYIESQPSCRKISEDNILISNNQINQNLATPIFSNKKPPLVTSSEKNQNERKLRSFSHDQQDEQQNLQKNETSFSKIIENLSIKDQALKYDINQQTNRQSFSIEHLQDDMDQKNINDRKIIQDLRNQNKKLLEQIKYIQIKSMQQCNDLNKIILDKDLIIEELQKQIINQNKFHETIQKEHPYQIWAKKNVLTPNQDAIKYHNNSQNITKNLSQSTLKSEYSKQYEKYLNLFEKLQDKAIDQQEILFSIQHIKHDLLSYTKFHESLSQIIISCSNDESQSKLSLKYIYKWIKQLMESYQQLKSTQSKT